MSFEYVAARLQGERDALQAEVERNAATLTTYKAEARGALALRDQYADQVAALQARIDGATAVAERWACDHYGFDEGRAALGVDPQKDGKPAELIRP